MDGGKTSRPKSKANVEEYYKGIKKNTIGTLSMNVIDEDFQHSDHNPVYMNFILK